MVEADLADVMAVAERVHPEHPEDAAVFEERLALFAAGCAVLADDVRLYGYRLGHPWILAEPPGLNTLLARLPATPDTLFLHDLALLPEARGEGHAREIVEETLALARASDLGCVSLIALGGSRAFWAVMGFRHGPGAALCGYGAQAVPMVRAVGSRG
jgi:GNAT superfamily N-acetyltransferase